MTKKIKISAKGGSASGGKTKKIKARNYSAHTLAIVLAIALILEGIVFGTATSADWQNAATILDVSSAVTTTAHDMSVTFQPLTELMGNIDEFYELATVEMEQILDLSDSQIGSEMTMAYYGISDFYKLATDQMMAVMDVSNSPLLQGSVAGISIQR